jgi:hypothetical protein
MRMRTRTQRQPDVTGRDLIAGIGAGLECGQHVDEFRVPGRQRFAEGRRGRRRCPGLRRVVRECGEQIGRACSGRCFGFDSGRLGCFDFRRRRGDRAFGLRRAGVRASAPFRKPLPGTSLDYIDTRAAVDAIAPGAYDKLSYTARVHAENIVRRADPDKRDAYLTQLIERRRDLDFPWFPARVVCHDILGQTALVDLAGLRDAIADMGGDPAKVNPVVPVQLIVDHSLAVEHGGFERDAFAKNRAIEDRRNDDRFHFIDWTQAFRNVDVIPPGNGIMHQINLERMSPVIHAEGGVAYPDTCVGTDSHTPHVDALGVIAIGVGGLEAENVMLGRASWMRTPDIVGVELTGKPRPASPPPTWCSP